MEPTLRAMVRAYEYEDWPRGRIVFDRSRDLFIIYADRKLMTPATIARTGTHRGPKRLPLSEQGDTKRDIDKVRLALKEIESNAFIEIIV